MNEQLFIAKKVKVGFNKRTDTYTGKLGYVIGHDGKKWRKEPSWEGWREKFQTPEAWEIEKKKQYEQSIKSYEQNIEHYKGYGASYIQHVKTHEEQLQKLKDNYAGFVPNTYSSKWSNDESINPVEFDNIPTSGFVLNRKAGGGSRGWDARATYCRVWDPRDFEFEISIPNLLFILQETTSTKGKGLEGDFVYSWDGKDLVLLPCGCEEYKKSAGFTKLQGEKIGVKDLIEGCSYKTKREEDLIYLGKLNWYTMQYVKPTDKDKDKYGRRMSKYNMPQEVKTTKSYIFYNEKQSPGYRFVVVSGLVNLATRNSDVPVSNYAELMEEFSKQKEASAPVRLEATPTKINFDEDKCVLDPKNDHHGHLPGSYYLKEGDKYVQYNLYVKKDHEYKNTLGVRDYSASVYVYKGIQYWPNQIIEFKNGQLIRTRHESNNQRESVTTKAKLEAKGFVKLELVTESGTKFNVENY